MLPYFNKCAAAAILLAIAIKRKKRKSRKKKRIWAKEWLLKREVLGQTQLLRELECTSTNDFKNYTRMDIKTFDELLNKVAHRISKENTLMRDAIPAHHRLALTLRFLASGNSYEDLKFLSAIAPQTIGKIVMETCSAIISELKGLIKLPQTQDEWRKEANAFNNLWNFPNCIGAIDGKHVNITKPPGSGSYYFNYKKTFSIILMAVVNANYEFMMVDVGTNGRASDAGLFNDTEFYARLKDDNLNIPEPATLPECEDKLPFVLVADDAFPLTENIMKPFSHNTLNEKEIIFNYRLSRARRIVENAFGIVSSRFRILLQTINLSPEKVRIIVLTCCYLHNFLRQKNEAAYSDGGFDIEETETGQITYADWRDGPLLECLQPTTSRNSSNSAKNVREGYCNYFNTHGAVPWQHKLLTRTITNK